MTTKSTPANLALSPVYALLWKLVSIYYPDDRMLTGVAESRDEVVAELVSMMKDLEDATVDERERVRALHDHARVIAFVSDIETMNPRERKARKQESELRGDLEGRLVEVSSHL